MAVFLRVGLGGGGESEDRERAFEVLCMHETGFRKWRRAMVRGEVKVRMQC